MWTGNRPDTRGVRTSTTSLQDGTPIRLLNIVEPLVIFHFAFSRSISDYQEWRGLGGLLTRSVDEVSV
jgi:hypothetical protein